MLSLSKSLQGSKVKPSHTAVVALLSFHSFPLIVNDAFPTILACIELTAYSLFLAWAESGLSEGSARSALHAALNATACWRFSLVASLTETE